MTIIPDSDVHAVVAHCYDVGGFTTRSDYARENAEAVAAAGIQGLITTEVPGRGFGSAWRASALGLDMMFAVAGRPPSIRGHGGLPDAFLQSLHGERAREPALSH